MIKNTFYYPLTATPFKRNSSYTEITPCRQLKSYVRCFWGTEQPVIQRAEEHTDQIVIPDTCADIIYYIDHTKNTVSGGFCGVNDHSFYVQEEGKAGHSVSTFAIRFYAWSVYAFAEDSLKSTANTYDEIGTRFEWIDRAVRPKLLELKSIQEKASYAEQLLTGKVINPRENEIVNHAVNCILINKGAMGVTALAKELFVSSRQLERLFHEYIGITPKKLSNLIRYQFLWRDILWEPDFNILNSVHKYGYTDQSHLLHEFKRYHSMDIHSAKSMAFENVGKLQDISEQISVK
ncbi:MAG: helix-turn-helix domain-containing protein [Lachnospiraceae bacterium]|nr:helix-turn-helix domain-containing protein [Lachnospiraceae bacterium]